jgi:DNA polymerase-3 subunit gamma/tau
MAYQVLARKYRPQRFSDVAGQDHVTRTLMHALEQERIAHGYIFSGHRGIGKTTIARILAMALNCRNKIGSAQRPTPEPCGICDSCMEIRAGNSLDVVEIDAATNRGIDEIRELREAARYAPARDRYKIYLLDEAHQITDAAFNALLKTLEEPPEHVVFMMATTQPEDIPQTIRSRCQHFSFHAVKFDDIVAELTQIATKEGIRADPQALALLAEAGDGSMRDALSIMDQAIASAPLVDGQAKLDGEEIRELMGTVPDAVFERMLEAIGEGQSAALMEELNRLLNAGNSPSQMARQMVRYLRNCLMAKLGGENTQLLQISGDERARAVRTATLFSEEDLTRFLQVMLRTFDELNYRQEPRLHLELGLMKLVHLQRLLPLEQILSGLPGAGRTPTPAPRPPAPPPAPKAEPAKPPPPSPFELDRLRKLDVEEEAPETPEAAPAPPTNLDAVRDVVTAALDDQGHSTAASLLADGRWKLDEEGAIQVEVRVKPTMLGLTMNAAAWKIIRDALRQAGATQKMTVVPGEGIEPGSGAARPKSRDSIEAVALGNPVVRHAQQIFHAEVRSVLDLREKDK